MKKSIALAIVGLAAGLSTSSYGQGAIKLDNYNTSGPYIAYGPGTDGTAGTYLNSAYTMGIYYWNALGNFTGSTAADPTGMADPATLGSYLKGTGAGSTAQFESTTFGTLGTALASSAWAVPIVPGPTGGATITLMVVAYEGPSYTDPSTLYRGHSAAFTLVTSDTTSPAPIKIGNAFQVFGVAPVPEPTTLALGGLGGLALLLLRRKQS